MNILIFGPNGSGKGTQGNLVKAKYNLAHIESGAIFREHIGGGTELGKKAKEYIDRGDLVPDDITIPMVLETLKTKGKDGWLLDGFPRNMVQAQKLFDEAKKLKSGIKTKRNALEEKTYNTIKALSDEEARRLLEAKWITPLQKQLEELPNAVIDELIGKVNALKNKYATTYADVCGQIDEAEKELAGMLGDLTGNARDLAGLEELKALLGGE